MKPNLKLGVVAVSPGILPAYHLEHPAIMDDESAEIELVITITSRNLTRSFVTDVRRGQLEQNLNKTRQISQRMICMWTAAVF